MASERSQAGAAIASPLTARARLCLAFLARQVLPMPQPLSNVVSNVLPIVLLVVSNVFMTFAWYGHLGHKHRPLLLVILVSWGIAFFEYCLAVPANRLGHGTYRAAELKTIQEVITLLVFAVFSVAWLGESLRWNHAVGFALLVAAGAFVFGFRPAPTG
jgi:uncharacterized protein (DUF486 family)